MQEKVSEISVHQGQSWALRYYCHVSGYVCIHHGLLWLVLSSRIEPESGRPCMIHEKNRQCYGERRIKEDLADQGKKVSRQRISRLMKEEGIVCKNKKIQGNNRL